MRSSAVLYSLLQGLCIALTACRKEAEASFPPSPTDPHRLEGTTLANRLAASRKYTQSPY